MKFIINDQAVEFNKKDLVRLEYHCTDCGSHKSPYLLIFTTTDKVKVEWVTEFRAIYEYFINNKLEVKDF